MHYLAVIGITVCFFLASSDFGSFTVRTPLFVSGLDLGRIDAGGKLKGTAEGAVTPLGYISILGLLFLFLGLLTLDGQDVIREAQLDVLGVESGDLCGELERTVLFRRRRPPASPGIRGHGARRYRCRDRTVIAEIRAQIVEQAVDLISKGLERPPFLDAR